VQARARTIEIDDSGTGDLVGDAFIGFHIVETGKIIFRSVPVGLYRERNYKEDRDKPRKYILNMVKDGLKAIAFDKKRDKIQICR
jgi:hypothetical protein